MEAKGIIEKLTAIKGVNVAMNTVSCGHRELHGSEPSFVLLGGDEKTGRFLAAAWSCPECTQQAINGGVYFCGYDRDEWAIIQKIALSVEIKNIG